MHFCPSWERDPSHVALSEVSMFFLPCYKGFLVVFPYSCWGLRAEDVTLLKPYETNFDLWIWVLGHGFWWTNRSGLHEKNQSLKAACPMWCSTRVKELSFPGASTSQRCENRQETQVSTAIGHSGPHDLWGHRANIRPVLPLFSLFPRILSEEKGSGPAPLFLQPPEPEGFPAFFLHRRRLSSWASPDHIFSSHPTLHGGELQLPAHLTNETSSQPKLYQPLSCDSTSSRRTSTNNWAAQLNRNQQDDFTELGTAQQLPFPPFQGR